MSNYDEMSTVDKKTCDVVAAQVRKSLEDMGFPAASGGPVLEKLRNAIADYVAESAE